MTVPILFLLCGLLFRSSANAVCPLFGGALSGGQLTQRMQAEKKAYLMSQDIFIHPGDPAWVIWVAVPYPPSVARLYNNSDALIAAQQFYVDEYERANAGSANKTPVELMPIAQLLRSVEPQVQLQYRCKARPACNATYEYVRPDGSCNNLHLPTLGSSYSPFGRLVPGVFDDGIHTLRRSRLTRAPLPSPRLIGNIALQHSVYDPPPSVVPNHGALIFGQYITHDVGFKDIIQNYAGGDGLRCCSKDNKRVLDEPLSYANCEAMEVPTDDPYYSQFGGGCLDYTRSQTVFANDCSMGAAQISCGVTQFIDHSTIYGNTPAALASVRSFVGGQMLHSANRLFPKRSNCTGDFCYYTGDIRGAFYPTLSLWHTTFMRTHNLIAEGLAEVNDHWSDERLFQETRRILMAILQNIVYNEWLPLHIGADVTRRRALSCPPDSAYCGRYDATVDATNMNEFNAGVFRFFHSNTPLSINMYDSAYALNRSMLLSNSIHGAGILETQYLGMMRGFFHDPILLGSYPQNIRNEVFSNENRHGTGLDLLATDIMRGRDHGLAPFHVYLELSWRHDGIQRRVHSWLDYDGVFSARSVRALREVYASPHDVDMLVGLLLEIKRGTLIGPVATYLMEEQFFRFKYGNRFFYTFADGPHPLTEAQIRNINAMRFADVLCASSDIERVPERVFVTLGERNPLVACRYGVLDLSLWHEDGRL